MSTYVTYLPSTSLTLPSQIGQAGKYLTTDGTSLSWGTPVSQTITSGVTAYAPSEDAVFQALALKVTGASSSTDGTIALFDGNTGKMIKQGLGWTVDSGALCSQTDGMYNIGKAADKRPGYVYVKTAINLDSLSASAFVGSNSSKNLVSLSAATATSYLNQFTSLLQGVVPASGGGTTNFLRADGNWAAAGVSTSSGDVYKVLASNGTTTTWQYSGLGDGSYPTNTIILGQGKPVSLSVTDNTIISATTSSISSGNYNVIVGDTGTSLTTGNTNTYVGMIGTGAQPLATAYQSVAIGSRTKAYGANLVVVGDTARAYSDSVAIGQNSLAGSTGAYNNSYNVVVGNNTSSYFGTYSVALGHSAVADQSNSVVIGGLAKSNGSSSVIIGKSSGSANLTGASNTVIGAGSGTALTSGTQNVILGNTIGNAYSTGSYNVSIGNSIFDDNSNYSINIGSQVGPQNHDNTVNIGRYQSTYGSYSVNLGHYSAVGANSVTMGYGQRIYGSNNVALGVSNQKYLNGQYMVSVGAYAGGGSLTSDNYSSFSNSVYLGAYAGSYSNGVSNELFIDNQDRGSYANQQSKSLLYGVFNSTASSQTITANAAVTATYGLTISGSSSGIKIKTGGAGATAGLVTGLTSATSYTVNTSSVKDGGTAVQSLIFVQPYSSSTKVAFTVSNIIDGVSFDVLFANPGFTGDFSWFIINRA